MSPKKQSIIVLTIILLALILDQTLKFYIKLNFTLGQAQSILPFFQLCFVENDGMAFGIEWFSKLLLTLFRIAAVALFSYYIYQLIFRQNARFIYIIFVALITAGALGNIIDCLFYGLIFSESTFNSVATLFPTGGGYAPLFYGKVVDMFYFPLIHNSAGETIFFRPVFNLADSFITISVFAILIFFSKDLNKSLSKNNNN